MCTPNYKYETFLNVGGIISENTQDYIVQSKDKIISFEDFEKQQSRKDTPFTQYPSEFFNVLQETTRNDFPIFGGTIGGVAGAYAEFGISYAKGFYSAVAPESLGGLLFPPIYAYEKGKAIGDFGVSVISNPVGFALSTGEQFIENPIRFTGENLGVYKGYSVLTGKLPNKETGEKGFGLYGLMNELKTNEATFSFGVTRVTKEDTVGRSRSSNNPIVEVIGDTAKSKTSEFMVEYSKEYKQPKVTVEGRIRAETGKAEKTTTFVRVGDIVYGAIESGNKRTNLAISPRYTERTIFDYNKDKITSREVYPTEGKQLDYFYKELAKVKETKSNVLPKNTRGEVISESNVFQTGEVTGEYISGDTTTKINFDVTSESKNIQQAKAISKTKQDITLAYRISQEGQKGSKGVIIEETVGKVSREKLPKIVLAESTKLIPTKQVVKTKKVVSTGEAFGVGKEGNLLPSELVTKTIDYFGIKKTTPSRIVNRNIGTKEIDISGKIEIGATKPRGETVSKTSNFNPKDQAIAIREGEINPIISTKKPIESTIKWDSPSSMTSGGDLQTSFKKKKEQSAYQSEETVYIKSKSALESTNKELTNAPSFLSSIQRAIEPPFKESKKVTTISIPKQILETRNQLSPIVSFRQEVITGQKLGLKTETVQSQITKPELQIDTQQRVSPKVKQRVRQEVRQIQEVRQDTVQTNILDTIAINEVKNIMNPIGDNKIKNPPPPKPPSIFKTTIGNSEKKQEGGFSLFVRKGGKFIQSGVFGSQETAFSVGQNIIQQTARASFKVVALGNFGKVSPSGINNDVFYSSKKESGVFIQKREKRISSPGEKAEITYRGLSIQKERRGNKGFKIF
jgi:hypothetical protein